jgi:hypothetical protein
MSKTHEIACDQWSAFLKEVSNKERNHKVRIESDELETGNEDLANNVPLVGISCEMKGNLAGAVDIMVAPGGKGGDYTHRVENAKAIYAMEGDDGDLECIDIEGTGKTLVYFD